MYRQLTTPERYQIAYLSSRQKNYSEIARELGRHRSTIKREVDRNSLELYDKCCHYDAVPAVSITRERRKEGCANRFRIKGELKMYLEEKLENGWSPDLIAGVLHQVYGRSVVHRSSIYRFIANDKEQVDGQRYYTKLPRFGKRRRGSKRCTPLKPRGERRSLRERSKGCNARREVGHFERDLMEGLRGKKAVLVIADRKSRKIWLSLVYRKSKSVQRSTEAFAKSQSIRIKSITNDNGHEFYPISISKSEEKLKAKIFYCDPGSPWQRGTVENVIGLLRNHFPKRTDFTNLSKYKLKKVEDLLNNRPRKILNYKTPSEIYFSQTVGKRKPLPHVLHFE